MDDPATMSLADLQRCLRDMRDRINGFLNMDERALLKGVLARLRAMDRNYGYETDDPSNVSRLVFRQPHGAYTIPFTGWPPDQATATAPPLRDITPDAHRRLVMPVAPDTGLTPPPAKSETQAGPTIEQLTATIKELSNQIRDSVSGIHKDHQIENGRLHESLKLAHAALDRLLSPPPKT